VRWRCVDLQEQVARRFSVTTTERTIGRWLRQLNLTRLQAVQRMVSAIRIAHAKPPKEQKT
jgi:hypothetical protein